MSRHLPLLVLALCGALLGALRLPEPLDKRLLDLQFSALRAGFPRPAPAEVVVVGVDEGTMKALPEPVALWHGHIAGFLRAMAAAQPAAVGVDIVLPDRSHEAIAPGYDALLLRALLETRRAYPLVLALTVDPSGAPRPVHRPFLAAAGEGATGYALLRKDADGSVRRFDEHLGEGGQQVATLAGQLARRLGTVPGSGIIDYARGATFDYVPLQRVLAWGASGDSAALTAHFGGRPVLLGMVLPFEDRQRVPVPLAAWEPDADASPGVLLHAQILRGLLGGGLIAESSAAVAAALAAAAALMWLVTGGMAVLALACGVFAVLLLGLSTLLLFHGVHLPVTAPLLTGVAALGMRNAREAMLKLRERRRLRSVFAGYVSPAVMERILAGQLHARLGGERKFVCVLFSDIRGYTAHSEQMTPEAVVRFLNRYFEEMVVLIHAHGGTITSFMGDGIMAVFGAPNTLDNPCQAAFAAGRDMLQAAGRLNARAAQTGEPAVEIGIGLHAGDAVVGHVGASSRHDYTAIGDVTNVASRLESATKEAGYRLVCSADVMRRLSPADGLAPLGAVAIKGHSPVEAYGHDRVLP